MNLRDLDMSQNQDKIKGKVIYCQAHKIDSKRKSVIAKDGHHEDTAKVRQGFCIVEVPYKWIKK